MARIRRDKRLVQGECSILESSVEVSIRPFARRLAHRQTALFEFREVCLGPLELRDHRRLASWWSGPDVTVGSRVRPTWPQRIEGIDHERKPLDIESDCF